MKSRSIAGDLKVVSVCISWGRAGLGDKPTKKRKMYELSISLRIKIATTMEAS